MPNDGRNLAIETVRDSVKPAAVNVPVSGSIIHPMASAVLGDLNAENEIVVPYYQNIPI